MSKKDLLFSVGKDDLVIEWYSGHGPGGTNRNRHKNCCRIKHPESGAVTTGQEERSSDQNLRNAFKKLAKHPKFLVWVNKKVWEIDNKRTFDQYIDDMMKPENLKIEILKDDKWMPWTDGQSSE